MKYNDFSSRIAWALNQISETIEEIAKNLGINKNTVAAYKKGKGDVKGSVIVGLFYVYGYDPRWMITGQGDPQINKETIISEIMIEGGVGTEKSIKVRKKKNINYDLLLDILKNVEILIADYIDHISLEKKSEAIALLYNYFISTDKGVDEQIVLRFLKLGESQG